MKTATKVGAQEFAYEPPESVMDKVLRLGRNTSVLEQLRNFVVASLTFDSFNDPLTAGVRSEPGASRQMTYRVDDFEIALSLRRSENRTLTLTGQILSKNSGPIENVRGQIDLVVSGDHVRTTRLSPWGEFSFSELPQSQYSLHLLLPNQLLLIPNLPGIDVEPG